MAGADSAAPRTPAASWTTQEQYAGLADWLREQSHPVYLLDCATLLTSNRLLI